jgi:hypothetical protein
MFDYSQTIEAFRDKKVRLSSSFADKLLDHRKANRDRLIDRLPDYIEGLTIGESSFRPQGSFAMQTVIQTRFLDEEYDIDDGLVLWKHQLVEADGTELSAGRMKEIVRESLKDKRFNRQPRICSNCVRVFYADEDEEKHHVDFPIYRRYYNADGQKIRELAGENGWAESDPTQVNKWFDEQIEVRSQVIVEWGTQLRHLIQLLKRFCRSRSDWDLPNGMKLTMLVVECQPPYRDRIDVAFRELLQQLRNRLRWNKVIRNLAHPEKLPITRSTNDQNVVNLETRLSEALDELANLDKLAEDNLASARSRWDWIFKSDGFFPEFDTERAQEEKRKSLLAKADLIANGARTSATGVLGATGVANLAHRFYGQDPAC